ncbi:hypothetical protein DIPPA_20073 [Diplonema papillatum]|nr:hypothetical protein DIPPA_20073 [Diplonema papillatum]
MPRTASSTRRIPGGRKNGAAEKRRNGPANDFGSIPPHLLPNRTDPVIQSPSKQGLAYHPSASSRGTLNPYQRGPSTPTARLTNRSRARTGNQKKTRSLSGSLSPGRAASLRRRLAGQGRSSPHFGVGEKAVFVQSPVNTNDLTTTKKQLGAAVEKLRRKRDKILGSTPQKKALNEANTMEVTSPGSPSMHKLFTNIDDVILHHSRVVCTDGSRIERLPNGELSLETVSPPRQQTALSQGDVGTLRKLLDQANETVEQHKARIHELEQRLSQREEHIDTLTHSLIDLGQHSSNRRSGQLEKWMSRNAKPGPEAGSRQDSSDTSDDEPRQFY